jgi:hypothetical protein
MLCRCLAERWGWVGGEKGLRSRDSNSGKRRKSAWGKKGECKMHLLDARRVAPSARAPAILGSELRDPNRNPNPNLDPPLPLSYP